MRLKFLNKFFFLNVFSACSAFIFGQSTDRQVINSTGGSSSAIPNFVIDYSVGECVVATGTTSNNIYTQGFLQPDTVFVSPGIFSVAVTAIGNETCKGASDGFVSLNVLNAHGPVTYYWPSISATGSLLTSLAPGTYVFHVQDSTGASVVDSVTIAASSTACDSLLDFYNGITPNNDGKNDVFYISNIFNFTQNNMYIYNRYGTKVWEGANYDNVNVVFSGKDKDGTELPAATYFYIFTYNGGEKKGYVELLR